MLLKAAAQSHTETGAAAATQQHSEVAGTSTNSRSMSHMSHDYPSTTPGGIQMRLSAQHSRTHPPMYDSRQQHPQAAHPVSHTPPPSQHRSTPDPLLLQTRALNPLYAPLVPKPKVGRQLTAAIAALEQPALDADAVQAALGFAAALEVGSDAAAAQSRQSRNTHSAAESIKLLQVLELSAGRLDVLRILTCRLTATGGPDGQEDSSTLSQLLLVIQDLMRDMESSQRLLQRAGAVLQGHQQAALQQVSQALAWHPGAAQECLHQPQLDLPL